MTLLLSLQLLNTHFPCASQSLRSGRNFDAITLAKSFSDLQVREYVDYYNPDLPIFKDGVLDLLCEMGYEEFSLISDSYNGHNSLFMIHDQLQRRGYDCDFQRDVKAELDRRDIRIRDEDEANLEKDERDEWDAEVNNE